MFSSFFEAIGSAIIAVGVFVSGIFGYPAIEPQPLGITVPVIVAVFETSLQSSVTSTATSMTLVAGADVAGNNLSGFTCFVIDEGTGTEEFVCGTASGTAISSMSRGIDPVDGNLEVTALKKAHRRGASVKITNYPSLGILSRILNGDESIPNILTYVSDNTFTSDQSLISKKYADDLSTAGAPNASTTAKGILEVATAAETAAGTATGSTGAVLSADNDNFNATQSATTLVPVTGTDGKLAQGFLDLTEDFGFTGQVGIGDTTPDGTLEVVSEGGRDLFQLSASASGDGDLFVVQQSGKVGLGDVTPDALH